MFTENMIFIRNILFLFFRRKNYRNLQRESFTGKTLHKT